MKYSEDIKMEIAGKFINGNYTDNLKLIYKDLNRLTKSAISEQLTLTDVGCSLDFDKLRKQFDDILETFDKQKTQDWLDKKY